MPRNGFAYVFNSSGYFAEAERSYKSLRHHMPDAEVAFVTHPDLIDPRRTDVVWVELNETYDTPIVKTEAFRVPFDKCIFLDTDTRVVRDCSDIFRLLERYDLALAHEPTRGWDYSTSAPKPFCELNTGVLAFRKNQVTQEFFEKWRFTYQRMRNELSLINDQPSFRETLWNSPKIRHSTLPSEYHLITGKPNSIAWDAHILHGRDNLVSIEAQLSERIGPRCYLPDLGVLGSISGRRAALEMLVQITKKLAPKLVKKPRSSSYKSPGDWEERATSRNVAL